MKKDPAVFLGHILDSIELIVITDKGMKLISDLNEGTGK